MQFLSQVSDRIQWCFTPVQDDKPTRQENIQVLGIIIVAVALRTLGVLNNNQTLFVTGVSSAYLLGNVAPIPLLTVGPVIVGYLAAITVAAYYALKITAATLAWLTRSYTLSELNDQLTYLDKNPDYRLGFETYTTISDRVRTILKEKISLSVEEQGIFNEIKAKLELLKTLEPTLLERQLARNRVTYYPMIYQNTTKKS